MHVIRVNIYIRFTDYTVALTGRARASRLPNFSAPFACLLLSASVTSSILFGHHLSRLDWKDLDTLVTHETVPIWMIGPFVLISLLGKVSLKSPSTSPSIMSMLMEADEIDPPPTKQSISTLRSIKDPVHDYST